MCMFFYFIEGINSVAVWNGSVMRAPWDCDPPLHAFPVAQSLPLASLPEAALPLLVCYITGLPCSIHSQGNQCKKLQEPVVFCNNNKIQSACLCASYNRRRKRERVLRDQQLVSIFSEFSFFPVCQFPLGIK